MVSKIAENNIVSLLQNKDKRGIEILYEQYADTLYGVVLQIVKLEDIAENILQEVFVKIWKNGATYNASKGRLFTWILNIARYTAIDFIRSKNYKQASKTKSIDVSVDTINRQVSTNVEEIDVREKVQKLDAVYQEVIELIYFRGYTQAETAKKLNIPLGTVKSRIRIAMRELRKIYSVN